MSSYVIQPYSSSLVTQSSTVSNSVVASPNECELVGVGTNTNFEYSSFIIGIIFGVILILIILLITYSFRGLFFAGVPTSYPTCTSNDYYNDPGVALANTSIHTSDILHVRDGKLYYRRVPITRTCIPGVDQTIRIEYPQYCMFDRSDTNNSNIANVSPPEEGVCNLNIGVGRTNGPAPHNSQASYDVPIWSTSVSAIGDCRPVNDPIVGYPLARWNPN